MCPIVMSEYGFVPYHAGGTAAVEIVSHCKFQLLTQSGKLDQRHSGRFSVAAISSAVIDHITRAEDDDQSVMTRFIITEHCARIDLSQIGIEFRFCGSVVVQKLRAEIERLPRITSDDLVIVDAIRDAVINLHGPSQISIFPELKLSPFTETIALICEA